MDANCKHKCLQVSNHHYAVSLIPIGCHVLEVQEMKRAATSVQTHLLIQAGCGYPPTRRLSEAWLDEQ